MKQLITRLSAVVVILACALSVSAAKLSFTVGKVKYETPYYSGSNLPTTVIVVGFNPSTTTSAEIPSEVTYDGNTFTVTELDASDSWSSIVRLTLPPTIRKINAVGVYAKNLTQINITDMDAWFALEHGLFTQIFNEATQLKLNGKTVTEVTFPDGVETIGDMFSNYAFLKKVSFPTSVKSIVPRAFYECSVLTEIPLSENIEEIGGSAFFHCKSVENLYVPGSVSVIPMWCFGSMTSLKKLDLGDGVIDILERAFSNCFSLESMKLPETLETIGKEAFNGGKLKKLEFPNSLISLGEEAFYNFQLLEEVKFGTGIMRVEDNAFKSCGKITTVVCPVDDTVPYCSTSAFDYSVYDKATLYVPAAKIEDYKKASGWSKFKNIKSLEEYSGISDINTDVAESMVVGIYRVDGTEVTSATDFDGLDNGIYIVRYDDGSIRKVAVK